jgi:hypothetical protein
VDSKKRNKLMASSVNPGEVSSKHGLTIGILKGTKPYPAFGAGEEPFSGRQGRADQGGRRDSGPKATSVKGGGHIEYGPSQNMGTPSRASGKPSGAGKHTAGDKWSPRVLKGTRDVGGEVAGRQRNPLRRKQIDSPDTQKPDFPRGASGSSVQGAWAGSSIPGGGKASPTTGFGGRSGVTKKSGAEQKAGPQSAYYGAANSRP